MRVCSIPQRLLYNKAATHAFSISNEKFDTRSSRDTNHYSFQTQINVMCLQLIKPRTRARAILMTHTYAIHLASPASSERGTVATRDSHHPSIATSESTARGNRRQRRHSFHR